MRLVHVWPRAGANTLPTAFLKGTTQYSGVFFQSAVIKKFVILAAAVIHFSICRTGRQHNIQHPTCVLLLRILLACSHRNGCEGYVGFF